MSGPVTIRPMRAADMLRIERQPSQRLAPGLDRAASLEEAETLIEGGEAWAATVREGPDARERIVALTGIHETFPGRQGVAWAVLSIGVGAAHIAITRHARARIAASPLVRIEAIVRAGVPAEVKWPRLIGLALRAELPAFGAASEDHLLFDRIRRDG